MENGTTEVAKKQRKPRAASKFIVIAGDVPETYRSKKAAIISLESRDDGLFTIACIHGVVETKTSQTKIIKAAI